MTAPSAPASHAPSDAPLRNSSDAIASLTAQVHRAEEKKAEKKAAAASVQKQQKQQQQQATAATATKKRGRDEAASPQGSLSSPDVASHTSKRKRPWVELDALFDCKLGALLEGFE